ncbi:MAG: hypothetical protein GTN89_10605 [Acidobacteria bacterium]|nr:hypothetical protein [Acidobacteriota bacterium]NIM62060.1 hypothetical protein [Acidobacteriota bacterium]NIO59709.1 hypothetical protein [Acidobacteriota bacterium]NIQ30798.1 hypothetical protein [Acidobacteriota bacterium]NIQ85860.1 hypothetical protein [Acidobacteriota bacterium]
MKLGVLWSAAVSLFVGLAVQTEAEVRVRTQANGEYEATVIVPGGPPWKLGIWGTRLRVSSRGGDPALLNPHGDSFGDLRPTVAEQSLAPHHPWVVWSRFNGVDYDLVYSSWHYAWAKTSPVTRVRQAGDDLDPSIGFSAYGQPILAWWNRDIEDGSGAVYYSVFTGRGWSEPARISRSFGGRHPVVDVQGETIMIHYDTDDGSNRLTFIVPFFDPATITDDIDPQTFLSVGGAEISAKGAKDKN